MTRKKPEGARAAEKGLSALEKRFAAFRPASAVLTRILAVPTRFIEFDHATRIGGWPIQRACIIHGPSNEGKTAFSLGLCGSFVEVGGMADLVDAEHTTTADWARELLGSIADSPRFLARRPASYEKCVDDTRKIHREVKEARAAGEIPEHASLITVVDSLRKLVPEDVIAKIKKSGASGEKGSVDGMGGRAAQIRAAMNAAWLDELVPLLDECRTAWVAIARESEDPEASMWDRKFGNDYKVQGGKAVVYDAALRCRIERDSWTTVEVGGKKLVIGERHKVTILKTKVGGKEDRATVAHFHTANGRQSSPGFDRARDVVGFALRCGVMEMAGNRVRWPSREKASSFAGRESAINGLREAEDDLAMLEAECRAKFETCAQEEVSDAPAPVEFPSANEEA